MSTVKETLFLIYEWLLKVERAILVTSSLVVVAIICAAVFMRYVMQDDLFAYDELVMIAAFWLYFIGAAYGSYEDSHIKADIIQISLSQSYPKISATIGLIARGLEVIFATCISYWGWSLIAWQFKFMGKTMGWGIPIVVPQSAVFLGFLLMTFYAVVHFIKSLQDFTKGTHLKNAVEGG